jgi:hypothetical protein
MSQLFPKQSHCVKTKQLQQYSRKNPSLETKDTIPNDTAPGNHVAIGKQEQAELICKMAFFVH